MSTINTVVHDTLVNRGYGQYMSYADPVIEALVQREQQIAEHLINASRALDLDPSVVHGALADAGMHVPNGAEPAEPVIGSLASMRAAREDDDAPEPQQEQQDPVLRMLADIQEQIANLTGFARQHGYRA